MSPKPEGKQEALPLNNPQNVVGLQPRTPVGANIPLHGGVAQSAWVVSCRRVLLQLNIVGADSIRPRQLPWQHGLRLNGCFSLLAKCSALGYDNLRYKCY